MCVCVCVFANANANVLLFRFYFTVYRLLTFNSQRQQRSIRIHAAVSLRISFVKLVDFLILFFRSMRACVSILRMSGMLCKMRVHSPELYAPISDIQFFFLCCWIVVYLRLQNKFMSSYFSLFFWCFSFESTTKKRIHEMIPSEIFTSNLNCALGVRTHTLFVPFVRAFPFLSFSFIKTKVLWGEKRKTNCIMNESKKRRRKVWSKLWLDAIIEMGVMTLPTHKNKFILSSAQNVCALEKRETSKNPNSDL